MANSSNNRTWRWQEMPATPTPDEILGTEPVPLPPRREDPFHWDTKDDYLESQYLMLRYDGTEGLRQAVQAVRESPSMLENDLVCIYDYASIAGYFLSSFGVAHRIAFNTNRCLRAVDWASSTRLKVGSLVAVSTARDCFRKYCLIGTVANRIVGQLESVPPKIDIFFADVAGAAALSPTERLIMVTARSGYYEAVVHAMKGLQMNAQMPTTFDKYLAGPKPDKVETLAHNRAPVDEKPDPEEMDESSSQQDSTPQQQKPTNVAGSLLKKMLATMDESQMRARDSMLNMELSIIQGPPGTGKTFTSLASLIDMVRRRGRPPIIIASHTNHALDQLLELCMRFDANIARLGSRSENTSISERTIHKLSGQSSIALKVPAYIAANRNARNAATRIRALSKDIRQLIETSYPTSCLTVAQLLELEIITQEDATLLLEDPFSTEGAELESWLHPTELVAVEPTYIRLAQTIAERGIEYEEVPDDDAESGYEWDHGLEEDEGPGEELFGLDGEYLPLEGGLTAMTDVDAGTAMEALESASTVIDINSACRGGVYNIWMERIRESCTPKLAKLFAEFNRCCQQKRDAVQKRHAVNITEMNIDIVGCTTTGLTKYRKFLEALEPTVLLIEEAAETCEANITSGLLPSLRQLVLVGDHKQLRPTCDRPEMRNLPYTLHVSMFERLVEYVDIPFIMLNVQRRMAPDIRVVISDFYPNLKDHPAVLQHPPVPGMGSTRMWLFDHVWPESSDSFKSKRNVEEARMVCAFANYLYLAGLDLSRLTILTFYNGQRAYINKLLRKQGCILRVSTIDSYQGEENDVIILSLVRSNTGLGGASSIGFMKDENRAVVACSRARCGFFVFGNLQCMLSTQRSEARDLWFRISAAFIKDKSLLSGPVLPAFCKIHKVVVGFENADSFLGLFGGCSQVCGQTRECGHACQLNCHPRPHDDFPCPMPCSKALRCGHMCKNACSAVCECTNGCSSMQSTLDLMGSGSLGQPGSQTMGSMSASDAVPGRALAPQSPWSAQSSPLPTPDPVQPGIRETFVRTPLDNSGRRTGRSSGAMRPTVDIRSSPADYQQKSKSAGLQQLSRQTSSRGQSPGTQTPTTTRPQPSTAYKFIGPHRKWDDNSMTEDVRAVASSGPAHNVSQPSDLVLPVTEALNSLQLPAKPHDDDEENLIEI